MNHDIKQLHQQLTESISECSILRESQFLYILNNQNDKSKLAKKKILVFILTHLNSSKINSTNLSKYLLKLGSDFVLDRILIDKDLFLKTVRLLLNSKRNMDGKLKSQNSQSDLDFISRKDSNDDMNLKSSLDLLQITNENKLPKKRVTNSIDDFTHIGSLNLKQSLELYQSTNSITEIPDCGVKKSMADKYTNLLEKYKAIQQENNELKLTNEKSQERITNLTVELKSIKDLYNQLTSELPIDKNNLKYDKKYQMLNQRKSMVYQSQIIQLKRQLDIYKEKVQQKEVFVYDVRDQIQKCCTILKTVNIESGKPKPTKVGKVIQSKPESKSNHQDNVKQAIKLLESVTKHITRGVQDRLEVNHEASFLFISEFICPQRRTDLRPVTLADLITGDLKHLNLKHVSRLECQLHSLYSSLSSLEVGLSTAMEPNISPLFYDRIMVKFNEAMEKLVSSMNSLVSLSCLIPAAPLPSLDQVKPTGPPSIPTITELLASLSISDNIKLKLKPALTTLLNAFESCQSYYIKERASLQEELEFHRNIYSKYNQTISGLMEQTKTSTVNLKDQFNPIMVDIQVIIGELSELVWDEQVVSEFLISIEQRLNQILAKFLDLQSNH
ncbi:hypothetical protein BC833DRAFT_585284 [Globomyces pollinis-pini]|nr:hypothetical protein BC833DRAFT_585284 [Globomyces pollinis-pini]